MSAAKPETNLQELSKSRKAVRPGDLFVMLPPDGRYLFGRVIRTDALGPMKALLIYIYADRSQSKEPPEELSPQSLLIPPTFTNRLAWTHGRFETIENRPLERDDVLERHCFYAAGRYYDEDARPLERKTERAELAVSLATACSTMRSATRLGFLVSLSDPSG